MILNLKKNGMIILIKNLLEEMKVFGFIITICLLTLPALTTCTCNGQRSTLEHRTTESQIDYFLYSGKLAKQIQDAMECATLKTEDLDFLSCHQRNLLIKQQFLQMLDSAYCLNQELMPKKCLQIKLYQYPLITLSFLNRSRTVWTDLKLNWLIEYQLQNSQEESLSLTSN